MTEIAMKEIVLCYEVHSTCIFRMLRQLHSLSKDSIFILSQFMNFDDYYLLLSWFLIAFLYPQIHFDW